MKGFPIVRTWTPGELASNSEADRHRLLGSNTSVAYGQWKRSNANWPEGGIYQSFTIVPNFTASEIMLSSNGVRSRCSTDIAEGCMQAPRSDVVGSWRSSWDCAAQAGLAAPRRGRPAGTVDCGMNVARRGAEGGIAAFSAIRNP